MISQNLTNFDLITDTGRYEPLRWKTGGRRKKERMKGHKE